MYTQFFAAPETEDQSKSDDNQLDDFLETLCLILYDNLRPLIIHITHLETLAELTSILRNEVVGQHCQQHHQLTSFKRVVTQMLADIQDRVATKILEDFGGALNKAFIRGQEPVSIVHYTRPGTCINHPLH